MAAYEGVSMSCGISAVPRRRPIFAASARRESGVSSWPELGPAASLAPEGAAQAAVPVPSTAAAPPAAPIARRLRRLMHFLLSLPEMFRTYPKNFDLDLSDNGTV